MLLAGGVGCVVVAVVRLARLVVCGRWGGLVWWTSYVVFSRLGTFISLWFMMLHPDMLFRWLWRAMGIDIIRYFLCSTTVGTKWRTRLNYGRLRQVLC